MWLPALQLLPNIEQGALHTTPVPGTRALKMRGSVADTGGSGAVLGAAAIWLAPLSIIAILIG